MSGPRVIRGFTTVVSNIVESDSDRSFVFSSQMCVTLMVGRWWKVVNRTQRLYCHGTLCEYELWEVTGLV